MTTGTSFVGINVSKARIDVAVRPNEGAWQGVNDETGIAALVDRLRVLALQLIVLDATGGLEQFVTAALALAGLHMAVVNPRQVRDFANATGRLAKTDAVDAAVLAHFAQALQPTAHPLPDAATQALAALVGLAPLIRDSGAWGGGHAIWGGRQQVRAALHMAKLVGVRHNPTLQAFYERLVMRGKPKKMAITACMPKLLAILHAVLRTRTPWAPRHVAVLT